MVDGIKKIRNASKSDIHKITSGQVIIDLESAVKELIENSLDAKSTNIDITFKNYGSEFVEVSDDGTGIAESDFNSIARKYHTSKLSSFDDIMESVNTFGFRGEAISSLCFISDVRMVTCTKGEPVAKYLEFDNMGNICNQKDASRQKGTTTTFTNIFSNLPVRRKIFLKNLKKEFTKAVNFLQNYCIVSEGVKISVYNIPAERSGKKLLFSTTRNSSMLDNIVSIYGVIMKKNLVFFDFDVQVNRNRNKFELSQYRDKDIETLPDSASCSVSSHISHTFSQSEDQSDDFETINTFDNKDNIMDFKLKGYISAHSFGFGRNASDRQLFFINSRPVSLPRFSRILNEVYRSFNRLQYPVVFLNIITEIKNLDINVTPDKKTVNIFNEAGLLEALKIKMTAMYDNFGELMPSKGSFADDEKRILSDSLAKAEEEAIKKQAKPRFSILSSEKQRSLNQFLANNSQPSEDSTTNEVTDFSGNNADSINKHKRKLTNEAASASSRHDSQKQNSQIETEKLMEDQDHENEYLERDHDNKRIKQDFSYEEEDINDGDDDYGADDDAVDKEDENGDDGDNVNDSDGNNTSNIEIAGKQKQGDSSDFNDAFHSKQFNVEEVVNMYDTSSVSVSVEKSLVSKKDPGKSVVKQIKENYDFNMENANGVKIVLQKIHKLKGKRSSATNIHNLQIYVASDFSKIKNNLKYHKSNHIGNIKDDVNNKFNPEESEESAEQKLSLIIKKQDFLKMRVIGQFNLGFIIVQKIGTDDVFIVDQHASDEKFNFEKLTNETVLESQRLAIFKKLELSSIEKVIVLDNLSIFQKNGFQVEHKCDAATGEDILYLKGLPVSKNIIFHESDFHELVSMLKENQDMSINVLKNLKIGKIRSIMAMRACRSSIMIGKPLSEKSMVKVVRNLNGLDKPWNCPHGRPTMRHLTNLKNIEYFNNDYIL